MAQNSKAAKKSAKNAGVSKGVQDRIAQDKSAAAKAGLKATATILNLYNVQPDDQIAVKDVIMAKHRKGELKNNTDYEFSFGDKGQSVFGTIQITKIAKTSDVCIDFTNKR